MAVYFVDSLMGDNSNSGISPSEALKNFEKINEMILKAGDKVLLKKGSVFNDHLTVKGSGSEYDRIEISFYGDDMKRPAIHTDDNSPYSVLITGEYVTLSGIEVSNKKGRNGIVLKSALHGATRGVTVRDCYIHDVWTINDLGPRELRPNSWPHEAGGISIETNREEPTWYEELRIEHNTVENINRTGIWLGGQWNNRFKNTLKWMANRADGMDDPWYPHKDVYIAHNLVDHAHGDGIVAVGCVDLLMEYNRVFHANCMSRNGNSNVALWTMNCTGALVQYNEVAYTGRDFGGDGEAFDIDQCNINNIFQYNYSHDNAGGFILVCNGCNNKDSLYNNIVRNNLSVNDATRKDDALFNISGPMRDIYFINNTVYTTHKHRYRLLQICDYMEIGPARDLLFANNLFYAEHDNNFNNIEAAGKLTFDHNICWNMHKLPERDNITDKNIYAENPVLFFEENVPLTRVEAAVFRPTWFSPLLRNGKHFEQCAPKDMSGIDVSGRNYIGAFFLKDLNLG